MTDVKKTKPADKLYAPWTERQVALLALRQWGRGSLHEYTCGECSNILKPTTQGWVCEKCTYTQNWCYEVDSRLV